MTRPHCNSQAMRGTPGLVRRRGTLLSSPVAVLMLLASVVGCGGSTGIERYDLSGEVSFQGQPVPKGYITFAPDKKAGNQGPGANATIIDGRYETLPGQGTVGGPHVVRIVGNDGVPYEAEPGMTVPVGKPLFPPHEMRVDLPREAATQDFAVVP
jgi:hypothetical protein